MHIPKALNQIPVLLFLITFLFYLSITGGNFWESDSMTVYQNAKSIVESFSFEIPCSWGTQFINGHCYSQYGIFMSVAIIPFYLLEKIFLDLLHNTYLFSGFFSSLTNAFLTSLLAVLFFSFMKKLNFTLQQSVLGSFLLAFVTYLPAFTKTLFSETLVTLLIYSCLYILFFSKLQKKQLFLSGLLFGLAILAKIAILIIGPIYLYIFIKKKRLNIKNISWFVLPILICVALFFGYNFIRFGSILDTGYRNVKLDHPLFYGLYIHIFSPGKSLFFYQPFVLLSFLGFRKFFNKQKLIFICLLSLTVLFFLFYSVYMHPTGDLTWGTRYLYPTIPFFVLGFMYFYINNKNKFMKYLAISLIIISLLIQLSSLYLSYHRYYSYLNTTLNTNQSYQYLQTAFNDPIFSPLIGQWRMIFRLGFNNNDIPGLKEAFQEYPNFNPNYKLATPDLFFLRSKREIPILLLIVLLEIYLVYLLAKKVGYK